MRKAQTGTPTRVIYLEDNGQDFLRFYVDGNNVIVKTEPAQGWIWDGRQVKAEVGDFVEVEAKNGFVPLRHRAERVVDVQPQTRP